MTQRRAGALRLLIRGLQFKIPARLAVGIVDQHHAVLVLQSHRLLFDYFSVLADEARAEDINDERHDWKPWQDIPRGAEIQAAEIAADGSDRGAAGKPVTAGANLFEALIGQHEVNHSGGRFAR